MSKSLLAAALVLGIALGVSAAHSGVAQPLVEAGFDTAPRVSPDGRWMIFTRVYPGRHRYEGARESLRIAPIGGSPERELVPTVDGTILAVWTPDNLVQITVENETRLVRPADGSVAGSMPVAAVWSPDGKWIAYVSGSRELYVSAPDGSSARRVASAGRVDRIGAGEFSPDSTRLSYSRSVGLNRMLSEVVRIDGSARRVLKEAPRLRTGRWSPDGTHLALVAQGSLARPSQYEPPRLWLVRADGSGARLLASDHASGPEWSPRGDWIAYSRTVSTPLADIRDIMIVRPSGADRRRVVRSDAEPGPWLAGGRRLLSVGNGACWRSGVLEIDVFRRTVRRLTNRCSVKGTSRNDTLSGSPLRDLIAGLAGDDSLTGEGGNDRVSGGPGDDSHFARDGVRDVVLCGPGHDRVVADRRDHVARDCEQVSRRT